MEGSSGRTKAFGHRRQPARVLPDGRPAGGERPAALLEPRPQEWDRRHTGVGFEQVLDPVVLQLGHELVDVPNVVSLPEFQQHSVEHNVDIPVRGGVGRWGALHGRVRRDLGLLGQVRLRMVMEVMRWCVDPARGFTLTSEEQFSMVRLMPDWPLPAQGGREILGTVLRRGPQIQEEIVDKVTVHLETPVVDVPVTMQLELQQSIPRVLEVPQIQFNDRVFQLPFASQTWVPTVQTVLKTLRSHRCSFGMVVAPAVVQRQVPMVQTTQVSQGGRRCEHAATNSSGSLEGVPQVQFGCGRRCEHAATRSGSAGRCSDQFIDKVVDCV